MFAQIRQKEKNSGNDAHTVKAVLRQQMLARRGLLPQAAKAEMDRKLVANLLASPHWQKAKTIFLYIALADEPNTEPLLENAWQTGKKTAFPVITSMQRHEMEFKFCDSLDDLRGGPFSLREPGEHCPITTEAPDLAIIPGLAFDHSGARLGYGMGFYDRFFMRHADWRCMRIGYCHDFQLIQKVPTDEFDRPVDAICTDRGLFVA